MIENRVWYGIHEVPEDQMITATVGPLVLSISHRPGEWRIGWHRSPGLGVTSADVSVTAPTPIADPEAAFSLQRFLAREASNRIQLRPLLADRPVVARPEIPLMVPAGEEAGIFVSTPVWVSIELPEPKRTLLELPVIRPSDTWFGPDTQRGIIAYASHTAARLEVGNLPPQPHRAITPIRVRNRVEKVLALERLCVPAPNLPLYASRGGGLWTAQLLVVNDSPSAQERVEMGIDPPAEAVGGDLITPPRESSDRNVFSRAFRVLVG